jgi:mono/diheme cytochrome c family protein
MRAATTMMVLLAACGAPVQTTCPSDLPASCVAPAPTWNSDVAPVFSRTCSSCHGPGGIEAAKPFTTWADVSARRTTVLSQIYGCKMPLPDAGVTLTVREREVVLHWLACGAPEN